MNVGRWMPWLGLSAILFGAEAQALVDLPALTVTTDENGVENYSISIQILAVMTIITLRTVINSDEVWLVHTATLAIMIVGSLVIPNQQSTVAVS